LSPAGVRRRARGAALIVSIGVLTLLLVVALTFFRASREEVRTADNSVNSIRAEMLADGATAVAIAFLQHDLRAHPSITSTDHAWRTYFNGAWAVGKPWMWAPLDDPALPANDPNRRHPVSPIRGGVPRVQWEDTFDDTNPNRTRDILYIPRVDFPNTFDTSVQNQGNPFRPVQNQESSFDDIIPSSPRPTSPSRVPQSSRAWPTCCLRGSALCRLLTRLISSARVARFVPRFSTTSPRTVASSSCSTTSIRSTIGT